MLNIISINMNITISHDYNAVKEHYDKELNKVIHHARTVKGAKKVVSHIILKNDKRRLN